MMVEGQIELTDAADRIVTGFSSSETAIYISELALELEGMAKQYDMKMVGYLLAMVAREASQEVFPAEAFTVITHQ